MTDEKITYLMAFQSYWLQTLQVTPQIRNKNYISNLLDQQLRAKEYTRSKFEASIKQDPPVDCQNSFIRFGDITNALKSELDDGKSYF